MAQYSASLYAKNKEEFQSYLMYYRGYYNNKSTDDVRSQAVYYTAFFLFRLSLGLIRFDSNRPILWTQRPKARTLLTVRGKITRFLWRLQYEMQFTLATVHVSCNFTIFSFWLNFLVCHFNFYRAHSWNIPEVPRKNQMRDYQRVSYFIVWGCGCLFYAKL